jgi:hypothetical protein
MPQTDPAQLLKVSSSGQVDDGVTTRSMRAAIFLILILLFAISMPLSAADLERAADRNGATKTTPGRNIYTSHNAHSQASSVPETTRQDAMTFIIESGAISISDLSAGHDKNLPGSVAIRIFSDRSWRLSLVASSPLQILDHMDLISISRFQIRSRATGGFVSFHEGQPVLLATGTKTKPSGELVLADLRVHIEADDPVGIFSSTFRVLLELE